MGAAIGVLAEGLLEALIEGGFIEASVISADEVLYTVSTAAEESILDVSGVSELDIQFGGFLHGASAILAGAPWIITGSGAAALGVATGSLLGIPIGILLANNEKTLDDIIDDTSVPVEDKVTNQLYCLYGDVQPGDQICRTLRFSKRNNRKVPKRRMLPSGENNGDTGTGRKLLRTSGKTTKSSRVVNQKRSVRKAKSAKYFLR